MAASKQVLLIISGGIAAYKCLELIRRLTDADIAVRCIMTKAAERFVTPLSVGALSRDTVYSDLFSLKDESEMGHIRLSREADLVVVAPATADIIAKMAAGIADDLATTTLVATDKAVLIAPAMNVAMWKHPATQRNIARLRGDGVAMIGPETGELADGEYGPGRMSEPDAILRAIEARLGGPKVIGRDRFAGPGTALKGRRAIVTAGPTREAIDPVRFLANRSSGKQGYAIAAALALAGTETILVTGPTDLPAPDGVTMVPAESARDMLAACTRSLPADIVICVAAVADWRVENKTDAKLKKGATPPELKLVTNPDILATLAASEPRPSLIIGFAAETERVAENAAEKRVRKGCDWMVANDVSPGTGTFGGDNNQVHLITADGAEAWPSMSKTEVAEWLVARIVRTLGRDEDSPPKRGPTQIAGS